MTSSPTETPNDLLIVGAGKLGLLIGRDWRTLHPSAQIVGETRTETSHELLRSTGITPVTAATTPTHSFPNVVFCAPPRGDPDYPNVVAKAAARVKKGGRMVFTSSGSVHGAEVTNITEKTPVVTEGRAGMLAAAEASVLARPEGSVVRLAGLYLVDRGAHSFWLQKGKVSAGEDGLLNLLWYGDAAEAVVKVLKKGEGQKVYLLSVEKSVTRREVVEVALRHPMFEGGSMPEFGEGGRVDRKYDNSWTRRVLEWEPKYESFVDFMEKDAKKLRAEGAVISR